MRLPLAALLALGCGVAQGQTTPPYGPGPVPAGSQTMVIPTGAATAKALADLTAQQGVLLDAFRSVVDADDTMAVTRAVAAGSPLLCNRTYLMHDYAMAGVPASFVLRGVPGKCVIQRTSASGGNFFNITATVVFIDGVTFDMNSGSVSANQWGVRLTGGGQTVSVRNSVLKNNSGTIGACFTIVGTGLAGGGSLTFENNEVTNCTLQAVYLSGVPGAKLSHNWLHDISAIGIFVGPNGATPSTNVIIDHNHFYRITNNGVAIGGIPVPYTFGTPGAIDTQIVDNDFIDNTLYSVNDEGDYTDVRGNHITQSAPSVTTVGAIDTLARYGKIQNNTITLTAPFAIDTGGSQAMLVTGNVVNMTQGIAFNTGGNLGSVITDNIANLSGTATGVVNQSVEGPGGGTQSFPTVSANTAIERNTFNMSGNTTVGVQMVDNAGGAASKPNLIRGNKFNVSGASTGPFQDIIWRGNSHVVIDGNFHNGLDRVFLDPSGSDIIFDTVHYGSTIQGISSTTDIRSIISRDLSTYGAGGSVLWTNVTAGGSGYVQSTTTIAFSGTGCTGQAATAQVNNGVLIGVKMSAGGSGCSGAVTATATDTSGGTGATLTTGLVPINPDGATINYVSASTHLLQKNGGLLSLSPGIPIQLIASNPPVQLQAPYNGGAWSVRNYTPPAFTVAALPTCNATSSAALAVVTDATTPTYGGTLTGGGGKRVRVECDGTNWISGY